MKRNMMFKDFLREVRKTKSRFLSILLIAGLGVAFLSGIRAASPDMKLSADVFYDDSLLMDVRVMGTLGLTEEDVREVEKISGVEAADPSYSADVLCDVGDNQQVLKLMTLTDEMNLVTVKEGRLPEKTGEIFLDDAFLEKHGYQIGDRLTLGSGTEEDIGDTLAVTEYTIVGAGSTPFYLSVDRGTSTIGSGTVGGFGFILAEDFTLEVYTELYLRVEGTQGDICYSDAYTDRVDEIQEKIEDIAGERCEIRYADIQREGQEQIAEGEAEIADAREQLADARTELDEGWQELNDGKAELEENRQSLEDGRRQLEEGKAQLEDGRAQISSSQNELSSAKAEIAANSQKLKSGRAALESAKAELAQKRQELEEGKAQLEAGKAQLLEQEEQLQQKQQELQDGKVQLEAYEAELARQREELEAGRGQIESLKQSLPLLQEKLAKLQAGIQQLEEAIKALPPESEELPGLQQQLAGLQSQKSQLEGQLSAAQEAIFAFEAGEQQLQAAEAALQQKKNELETGEAALQDGMAQLTQAKEELAAQEQVLASGEAQLNAGQAELNKQEQTLAAGEAQLSSAQRQVSQGEAQLAQARRQLEESQQTIAQSEADLADGEAQLADGEKTLQEAEAELQEGEAEYQEKAAEAEQEIADGEAELAEARQELADLKEPEWYVLGRDESIQTYVEYDQDAQRIDAIGQVFPAIFFLVAALVCLTTMTRMVEENRTQIGTLKALGYGKGAIAGKYIGYAFLASLLGGLIGLVLGQKLLPVVIMEAYGILYNNLPVVRNPLYAELSIYSTGIAVAVTTAATLFACYHELREVPAQLMRPEAPKNGKRVFMERISFLWRRLNFTQKSTVRNLIRYKKRFFMTVLGIGGCMGLLLVGFGLKDSIMAIGERQFEKIRTFSSTITLEEELSAEEKEQVMEAVESDSQVEQAMWAYEKTVDVGTEDIEKSSYLVVAEDMEQFPDYVTLRDRSSGELYQLENQGVVMTEKLAKLLEISEGDTIWLKDGDKERVQVTVSHIAENYFYHYIYMTQGLYEQLYGETPDYGEIYTINASEEEEFEDELQARYMEVEGVLSVSFNSGMSGRIADMLKSMDTVIYVLVISAGLLAFIVLYNLNNINISERKRELATLKVLGFYDREVTSYVTRENICLTLIGCIAGVVIGQILHRFVIVTAEIDLMMFGREIKGVSYLYSVLLTLLFSVLVNVFMHFHLKKVDMVESMKSVE